VCCSAALAFGGGGDLGVFTGKAAHPKPPLAARCCPMLLCLFSFVLGMSGLVFVTLGLYAFPLLLINGRAPALFQKKRSSFMMLFKFPMNSWSKVWELPMLQKKFPQCHQISALLTSMAAVGN
jgi:hypothetical protein